jgi:hypothetical protein
MTEYQHTEPIDPQTGEYRQDIAEQPNTPLPKKSGVQINIDESNEAAARVGDIPAPATFDKTPEGVEAHNRKFGVEKGTERAGEVAVNTEDTTALNPTRQGQAKNLKRR